MRGGRLARYKTCTICGAIWILVSDVTARIGRTSTKREPPLMAQTSEAAGRKAKTNTTPIIGGSEGNVKR